MSCRFNIPRLFLVIVISSFTLGVSARGQETPEAQKNKDFQELKRSVEEQRRLNDAQQEQIDAQNEKLEKQQENIDTLEESIESQELEMLDGLEESLEVPEQFFQIYGFFDISFIKRFQSKKSPFGTMTQAPSSFVINNLNIYFHSRLTETVDVLSEIRFSFLPNGAENSFDVNYYGTTVDGEKYDRTSTEVRNYSYTDKLELGGIEIERIHVTYSPFDWLYVRAGRYFTPYGIWNIDHSSTVVIPARVPYMQAEEIMPKRQVGLEVGGRFFPTARLYWEYAITLSNGRGPMDTVWDLDENKAIGLKLQLGYETPRFSFELGGYGYFGKYTDIKKTLVFGQDVDPDTLFELKTSPVEQYKEYIWSTNLKIVFHDVLLQAEYVRRYVIYLEPSLVNDYDVVVLNRDPLVNKSLYYPSYIGWDYYVLLGWDLPLRKWLGQVHVIPFVLFEQNESHPTIDIGNIKCLSAGLTVKPMSNMSMKLQVDFVFLPKGYYGEEKTQSLTAQLAVFF